MVLGKLGKHFMKNGNWVSNDRSYLCLTTGVETNAASPIEYRKTHGSLKAASELMRVPGIGPKILNDIEDLVAVE